jgi:hypothetical protein
MDENGEKVLEELSVRGTFDLDEKGRWPSLSCKTDVPHLKNPGAKAQYRLSIPGFQKSFIFF